MFWHSDISKKEIKEINKIIHELDIELKIEKLSLAPSGDLHEILNELEKYIANLYMNVCQPLPKYVCPLEIKNSLYDVYEKTRQVIYTFNEVYHNNGVDPRLHYEEETIKSILKDIKDEELKSNLKEFKNSLMLLISRYKKAMLLEEDDLEFFENFTSKLDELIEQIKQVEYSLIKFINESNYSSSKAYKRTKIDLNIIDHDLVRAKRALSKLERLIHTQIKLYNIINKDEKHIKELSKKYLRSM